MQIQKSSDIKFVPLTSDDKEQFILDNQEAFNYGALEEFGKRDEHLDEEGQIISRKVIEDSIADGEAYRIIKNNEKVGGLVIKTAGDSGALELLFVSPKKHSKGVGYAAWCLVEQMHPEVKIWETHTPYVNKCGFHIVEFFCKYHPESKGDDPTEEYLRFEKIIK